MNCSGRRRRSISAHNDDEIWRLLEKGLSATSHAILSQPSWSSAGSPCCSAIGSRLGWCSPWCSCSRRGRAIRRCAFGHGTTTPPPSRWPRDRLIFNSVCPTVWTRITEMNVARESGRRALREFHSGRPVRNLICTARSHDYRGGPRQNRRWIYVEPRPKSQRNLEIVNRGMECLAVLAHLAELLAERQGCSGLFRKTS